MRVCTSNPVRSLTSCGFAFLRFSLGVFVASNCLVFLEARALVSDRETAVLYINKHFEVRDYDAPTKYVWNGKTRVASVTGSLSTNTRVQRMRLFAGWNLLSLAVSAPNSLSQISQSPTRVDSVYKWVPAASNFVSV